MNPADPRISFRSSLAATLAAWLSLLVLVAAYWAAYAIAPEWHQRWLRGEDKAVEWLTAIGFLAASGLTLAIFHHRAAMNAWTRLYFAGLALFFFVCAGEELSWGQRIVGFATPEAVNQINEQHEFNLHNLHLRHVSPLAIVSFLLTGFGVVAPVTLAFVRRAPAALRERYVGPLWLAPCFLTAAGGLSVLKLFKSGFGTRWPLVRLDTQELMEMAWGLSSAAAAAALALAWKRHAAAVRGKETEPS